MNTQQMDLDMLTIEVSDTTGSKVAEVSDIESDLMVPDFIDAMVQSLDLPRNDPAGNPVAYRARIDREGRHMDPSRSVREEGIQQHDRIRLEPDNIDAGAGARS